MDKEKANRTVEKVIEEFSFNKIRNQRAKTLLGGCQRRLSIAMAIMTTPKVLFLDEPILGLDVLARRESLWHDVLSHRNMTIFFNLWLKYLCMQLYYMCWRLLYLIKK